MTRDHTTPGELADLLRVTGRTVQRMANAYIEVFGSDALLPDPRHRDHRVFPPVAVERLQRAADLTRLHRGLSTRQALESIRDGQELAKPRTRPAPAASDSLVERLLEEVQRLQAELVALRRDLLDRYAPERPDMAPSAPTPDPDPAPVAAAPSRPAQRPARLQEKHQELLDSLHMGETLKVRPGGRTGEIAELHDISGTPLRQIDPRTIAAMLRYGLLERVGDQYHAAPDAPRQDVTPPASETPRQDAVTDQPDLETKTGQTADMVSESEPAPAPGSELPRFTGRAAELYQRLLAGAELADNDPTFMVVMDGKAMGTVPRATAQRLLAVEGLLTQVAPGRWVITPALLP